jgi:hypothetical protein
LDVFQLYWGLPGLERVQTQVAPSCSFYPFASAVGLVRRSLMFFVPYTSGCCMSTLIQN